MLTHDQSCQSLRVWQEWAHVHAEAQVARVAIEGGTAGTGLAVGVWAQPHAYIYIYSLQAMRVLWQELRRSSMTSSSQKDPSRVETQILETPDEKEDKAAEGDEGPQEMEDGEEEEITQDEEQEEEMDSDWDADPEKFRSPCQPHEPFYVSSSEAEDEEEKEPKPTACKNKRKVEAEAEQTQKPTMGKKQKPTVPCEEEPKPKKKKDKAEKDEDLEKPTVADEEAQKPTKKKKKPADEKEDEQKPTVADEEKKGQNQEKKWQNPEKKGQNPEKKGQNPEKKKQNASLEERLNKEDWSTDPTDAQQDSESETITSFQECNTCMCQPLSPGGAGRLAAEASKAYQQVS